MKTLGRNSVLGYCTNVHPGTSPEAVLDRIGKDCLQIKNTIDPSIHFGIGLWLSAQAAQNFKKKHTLERLKQICHETQIKIFSWNAFPYWDFHQPSVKEQVYSPNWSDASRLEYTLDLLEIIRGLSFDLLEVSISTLPIADQKARLDTEALKKATSHLIQFVGASSLLEKETGIRVHLALEPEPLCFLETSSDVVLFFKDYLLPQGTPELANLLGINKASAESLLLDKVRVCYDTCHAAVLYETPTEILKNYDSLGIRIGKVQLSSALVYHPSKTFYEQDPSFRLLTQLSSDRYLHQVTGIDPNQKFKTTYDDLPNALADWRYRKDLQKEYRIHYHVPIFLKNFESLQTTQQHILDLFSLAQKRHITSHWEVETYTWPSFRNQMSSNTSPSILPNITSDITSGIIEELNWVHRATQVATFEEIN